MGWRWEKVGAEGSDSGSTERRSGCQSLFVVGVKQEWEWIVIERNGSTEYRESAVVDATTVNGSRRTYACSIRTSSL